MRLYPDDPTLGIPFNTGTERFAAQGYQYKRIPATLGDVFYHAPRLDDARHYALHSSTYIYRFNTRPFVNNTKRGVHGPDGQSGTRVQGRRAFQRGGVCVWGYAVCGALAGVSGVEQAGECAVG